MTMKTEPVHKLRPDDIVIAFMGPTGSGKSHIIDKLTGALGDPRLAGSTLESWTKELNALRIKGHRLHGDNIVLLDTPGFDDTTRTDIEVLEMINEWLVAAYKEKVTLAGIIYLHRITNNRMAGAPHRNLRMFGELCGEKAVANVVLVTTMWDKVKSHVGDMREEDLKKNYWNKMTQNGAATDRFYNTSESAWAIIESVIVRRIEGVPLLLQEEIVDFHRQLKETRAAQMLYTQLQVLLSRKKDTIRQLQEQAKEQNDPKAISAFREELEKVQKEFDQEFMLRRLHEYPPSRIGHTRTNGDDRGLSPDFFQGAGSLPTFKTYCPPITQNASIGPRTAQPYRADSYVDETSPEEVQDKACCPAWFNRTCCVIA